MNFQRFSQELRISGFAVFLAGVMLAIPENTLAGDAPDQDEKQARSESVIQKSGKGKISKPENPVQGQTPQASPFTKKGMQKNGGLPQSPTRPEVVLDKAVLSPVQRDRLVPVDFPVPLSHPYIPRPDLAVTAGLDGSNRLIVRVRNDGTAEVPADMGNIVIFIDGKSMGTYHLGRLLDQSFRTPGGRTDIPTNFRLGGILRRILIRVDTLNEVLESNEFQNDYSVTLNPPVLDGPDYIVSDLDVDSSDHLIIRIHNQGNRVVPPGATAKLRIIINDRVVRDLTHDVSGLAMGEGATVGLTPAIGISRNDEVRVLLNMPSFYDELDDTNNVREERLPNRSALPYLVYLLHPTIAAAISWNGRSYEAWSSYEKAKLTEILQKIENGQPFGLDAPPVLTPEGRVTADDALTIYLAHVAQTLWVDLHSHTSWRLNDMAPEHLSALLDSQNLIGQVSAPGGGYAFNPFRHGTGTIWAPHISWQFLQNLGLLKTTQKETVIALAEWMRAHLFHTYTGLDIHEVYQYTGRPPIDRILYPMEGNYHLTIGCWGTPSLFIGVLRSINIPARVEDIYYAGIRHRRPVFPTLGLSMAHADDVHTQTLKPTGHLPHFEAIFESLADIERHYISPVPECVGGVCNTESSQAGYNAHKKKLQLAVDVTGDFLLNLYARDGEAALRDTLTGIEHSEASYEIPLFTSSQQDMIVNQVTSVLTGLGSGDIEEGSRIVTERSQVWARNIQHRPIE